MMNDVSVSSSDVLLEKVVTQGVRNMVSSATCLYFWMVALAVHIIMS